MNRWERRWQDRWEVGRVAGGVTRLEQCAVLPHGVGDVWALIVPAESSLLLTPDVVARAFRVPGTPPGLGEQQCFLGHDGSATVIEVVEFAEWRRAVTRLVTPAGSGQTFTYDLVPLDAGCRLTYGTEVALPPGSVLTRAARENFDEHARCYLERVRSVLDDRAAAAAPARPRDPSAGTSGSAAHDPWHVLLDDDFVAAARVREQPGHARADAARRINADHARVQPWRSSGHPAHRTRASHTSSRSSWLRPLVAVSLALVVAGIATSGPGGALGRVPGATSVARSADSGDGTPVLPPPVGAQDQRLLPAPVVPAGNGGWSALQEHDDRPVGFDPCRPVRWVLTDQAPADALPLATEAFARLSEATGLVFLHEGTTEEDHDADRGLVQLARYGERYAPVLVAWSDEGRTPELAGPVAGFAGPRAADPEGAGPRYVSGIVVLDGPDLRALPGGYAAQLGVLLHELGHLAGLDHVADPADSMHASSGPASSYSPGALRGLAAVGSGPCFLP